MGCGGSSTKDSLKVIKLDLSRDKIGDMELKMAIPILEQCLPKEAIKMVSDLMFSMYDKDNNGHLDRNEMKTFLQSTFKENKVELELDEAYITQFINDFDKSGNKQIEPDELQKYFQAFFKHIVDEMKAEVKKRGI
jgi:Ca2+-binding EF-hand superfamily protein